jgi:hypothetical protein
MTCTARRPPKAYYQYITKMTGVKKKMGELLPEGQRASIPADVFPPLAVVSCLAAANADNARLLP